MNFFDIEAPHTPNSRMPRGKNFTPLSQSPLKHNDHIHSSPGVMNIELIPDEYDKQKSKYMKSKQSLKGEDNLQAFVEAKNYMMTTQI